MVKPALAAARAVAVLDHLAAAGGRPHTLSELSRAIDVNQPSLMAVLRALEDRGYLMRHRSHKTYTLGPASVALGHSALRNDTTLHVAYAEMQLLADEMEAECSAAAVVGAESVIVATAGRPRSDTADVRVGTRIPLVPPFGTIPVAWGSADDIAGWLARSPEPLDPDTRSHLRAVLAQIRLQGYAVGFDSAARRELGFALRRLTDEPLAPGHRSDVQRLMSGLAGTFFADDLADGLTHPVSIIMAPVFGQGCEVELVIALQGFAGPMDAERIAQVANRLKASTNHITRQTSGRSPDG
ncbi:MAG: helix-turn-helix domain-containing protein [Acidimicrobiales bacterium]|nr:helix-turn-helix domain-containing protein [Acidimicrobiales bacterium]